MAHVQILWSLGVMITSFAALFDLTISNEKRPRAYRVSSGIALTLILVGAATNICVLAGWL
jgi:hypothetical protein